MSAAPRILRAAGLLTGLALAGLLVFAFRVPASDGGALGAHVRMEANLSGELTIPERSFLNGRGLVAGGSPARGRLRLRNITPGAVDVSLRTRPESRELDSALRVELWAGTHRLAAGPLGSLRRWSRPVRIAEGGAATVRATASVPADADDYAGRSVVAAFDAGVRPAGQAR